MPCLHPALFMHRRAAAAGWLQPVAKFGAGRPLGYHFDAEGHLVVADSLKVGSKRVWV
jgi:hypothetical protein